MSVLEYLSVPARQASVVQETGHRPWPLPGGTWVMAQTWDDLLFAHWRVDTDALRRLVPRQLELDAFDGETWLGITPFRVTNFRLRGTLPFPVVSSFEELNVRTYVPYGDKPGIFFFSLDAASRAAVEGARRTYKLPYFHARMSCRRVGRRIHYTSSRRSRGAEPFVWEASYEPARDPAPAQAGTLEYFLTERYCLYTVDGGTVKRAEIHHPPWPLQGATAEIELNTMPPRGLELPDEEPLLHFSERQDVVIWPLQRA